MADTLEELHQQQLAAGRVMLAALKQAWETVDLYEAAYDVRKAIAEAEAAGIVAEE